MIARLGIVGRLALILLAALIVVQMATTALYFFRRDQLLDSGLRSPLADQVAAVAELMDDADAEGRAKVLRAVNAPGLLVQVVDDPAEVLARGRSMPVVEDLIKDYLGTEGLGRVVAVRLIDGAAANPDRPRWFGRLVDSRIIAVIGLADHRYLVVEPNGDLMPRVFGLQPGFFAGIVGFLVGLLALLGFSREARPLRHLAKAVESFGAKPEVDPVKENGAREVRVLIRAFNDMQGRLVALMRNRAFILGALAHDLRTYLTRLRLRAEFLADDEDRQRWIRTLDDMHALVEDSLTFARASFGADPQARSDLAAIVTHQVEERAAMGAAITADLAPGALFVRGGAAALTRAIANVIDNALKYGGSADLTLRREGTAARLEIADRGPGIPLEARANLGEPFQRLEVSRNRDADDGAGLGLAIATQVVTSLGGRISFGDRPGGGACVTLHLVLADRV
ncbi:HAMP domain-containing protein [Oleomonas cavernae]|uniref:histidine kinase n=1 Tax=Oleomonas cavernae TaxID=2320859 RepID=A0A418WG82_9PROT|nr:ATP-binding protein [Oleomonas cavernae]RJF89017.1 HAMP domain-containing protein [Oleomonas cavernae]